MRIVRYGEPGRELPGMLDGEGQIRALRPVVSDIDTQMLSPAAITFLEALDPERLPLVPGAQRLGAPVSGIRQIIAIGLNYRDHAIEAGLPIPAEPVVFMKSISSIAGPDDDIVLPSSSSRTDWEAELAIVIGAMARRVPVGDAADCIAGYCMANDVSERDWQMNRAGQWGKGKSFDTFTPVGPWLVTRSSMEDPQSLRLELSVNGVRKQYGSTTDMIFSVAEIVSYVSEFMTLAPGDLIITGTPAGVGMGMAPPEFLKTGDLLEMSITGLGTQRHRVA